MHQYKGKLILHTGSMFSGKTSSLKKDLNRFRIANYKVKVYKPKIDTRDGKNILKTHDDAAIVAMPVANIEEMLADIKKTKPQVVGIDEVQFLDGKPEKIRFEIEELLNSGITVVAAGLDMDFNGRAFEVVKELFPIADYVDKHHAVCVNCGSDAWISHRKVKTEDRLLLGAESEYEPLCRSCYLKIKKEEEKFLNKNQLKIEI